MALVRLEPKVSLSRVKHSNMYHWASHCDPQCVYVMARRYEGLDRDGLVFTIH